MRVSNILPRVFLLNIKTIFEAIRIEIDWISDSLLVKKLFWYGNFFSDEQIFFGLIFHFQTGLVFLKFKVTFSSKYFFDDPHAHTGNDGE